MSYRHQYGITLPSTNICHTLLSCEACRWPGGEDEEVHTLFVARHVGDQRVHPCKVAGLHAQRDCEDVPSVDTDRHLLSSEHGPAEESECLLAEVVPLIVILKETDRSLLNFISDLVRCRNRPVRTSRSYRNRKHRYLNKHRDENGMFRPWELKSSKNNTKTQQLNL